jgi:hypothetical protein
VEKVENILDAACLHTFLDEVLLQQTTEENTWVAE